MNAQSDEPPLSSTHHANPLPGRKVRQRWPSGILGTLCYLWDHKLYGFNYPVDWPAAFAAEEAPYPWVPNDAYDASRKHETSTST